MRRSQIAGVAMLSLALVILHASSVVLAAGYGAAPSLPGPMAPIPTNRLPPPPPPTANPIFVADLAAVKQAQLAYDAAAKQLAGIQSKAEAIFNQNPDWLDAVSKLKSAQAEFNTAKSAMADHLASNPNYAAAKAAYDKASADLDAAKGSSDASVETRINLANAKLQYANQIEKLKNSAADSDPACRAAATKVAAAQAVVDQIKATFMDSLSKNSDWTSAKKSADDAKQKLDDAVTKYANDQRGLPTPRSGRGTAGAASPAPAPSNSPAAPASKPPAPQPDNGNAN